MKLTTIFGKRMRFYHRIRQRGIKKVIILLVVCLVGCGNNQPNNQLENNIDDNQNAQTIFEKKVDSLKQILSSISTDNQTFDFHLLSKNEWDWWKKNNFIIIDSLFFYEYANKPTSLTGYGNYYQTNYFYKIIDIDNGLFNVIVLQRIHNDNECYMYLLQFDKYGKRKNTVLLASLFKSPSDYEEIKSEMRNRIITTYKLYQSYDWDGDKEEEKKDTTVYILN